MVDRPEDPQNGNNTQVAIIISDDDDDNVQTPAPRRDKAAGSSKQKRPDSGSRPHGSQTQKKPNGAKLASTQSRPHGNTNMSPVTISSSHSGSQSSRPKSQQHPISAKPSTENTTLAQRAAGGGSASREPRSASQTPRMPPSSSGKATSTPASQVQISRGPKQTGSTTATSSRSGHPSDKSSQKKRNLENDVEIGGTPAAKRLKPSQGHAQSSTQPPTIKPPGKDHASGAGRDNPIDLELSNTPPPETSYRSLFPEHRRSPKQSRVSLPSKTAKPSVMSSSKLKPKPKTIEPVHNGENRSKDADVTSGPRVESPTIAESPPASPIERNTAITTAGSQNPELPRFNQPLDDIERGDAMGAEFETISSFASAVLSSPTFDTSASGPSKDDRSTTPVPPVSKESATTGEDTNRDTGKLDHQHNSLLPQAPPTMAHRLVNLNTINVSNHIEQVIHKYVQELRGDNQYWTRTWLKRARHMAKKPTWSGHAPTSVFRDMKPIEPVLVHEKKPTSDYHAKFEVEKLTGSKNKRTWMVPCTRYHASTDADVPNYSHFVGIKHSFLAKNETVLQHWPYFHDEFDMTKATDLKEHYSVDVEGRERKLQRLAQAENYAEYVEDMLRDIPCSWSDVLRFLLDPQPDVGNNFEARAALRGREDFCKEDFVRGGQRWTTVLSKLPLNIDPDRVGRAALLCQHFQKIAEFPLWHVARRSDYTAELLQDVEENSKPSLDEMTCRVCMRYDCPYHGEIHEHHENLPSSDSEQDVSDAGSVVETDIIHPHRVNYRSRVKFPPSVDTDEPGFVIDPKRRKVEYWHKQNWYHNADERKGPFYPCYHPGKTCEAKRCSCFVNRTPCERSCSCPQSCRRKWQGCDCKKKGGLVCFEDMRCACFKLGRECDADLCGDCGVADVLDPIHRHDDTILHGRCHNASIQRGVPKHTILGDSGIHGLGLYACEDIQQHDFVGEYKGEIITTAEAERRGAVYEHQKLSYLFSLNKKQEVDSTLFGNKIRFINHAIEKHSNLYPRIIMVNTVFRIALYGQRKIKAGQELLFDYGPQFPQDQLGNLKPNKEKKAAPHVRNSNLVAGFDDVVTDTDKFGNKRARKAPPETKRGGSKSTTTLPRAAGSSSLVARKSTTYQPGTKFTAEEFEPGGGIFSDEMDVDADAGQRLSSYNIAQEDDVDDDDFDARNSSVDGEEDDADDEDEYEPAFASRPRSSRLRKFGG